MLYSPFGQGIERRTNSLRLDFSISPNHHLPMAVPRTLSNPHVAASTRNAISDPFYSFLKKRF